MEAHIISFLQEIEVATLCPKALVDSVLRLPRAHPGTLYGERYHTKKCQILRPAKK
jgi:hypothetical protein